MVKIRQWTRPKPFEAQVSEKDFELDEEEIPDELQPGGNDYKLIIVHFAMFFRSSLRICLSHC